MTQDRTIRRSWSLGLLGAGIALLACFPWLLTNVFSSNYEPHGYCFLWDPRLVGLHVTSDLVTGIAYVVIAVSLARLVYMTLREIPFQWMFLIFGVFILACGFTHFMSIVVLWHPLYWLEGDLKLITACASAITAAMLPAYLPAIRGVIRGAASSLKNERRLNAVLESTSDQVVTISHQWIVLYANRRAVANFRELKIGASYWTCFPTMLGAPTEQYLHAAMTERSEQNYELFFAPYRRWYRVKVFPVVEGISLFFSDITEAKKIEEQLALEQLLREKRIEALTHMAAGLAHEISNPLAIIHGLASDLLQLAPDQAPVSSIDPQEVRHACENIVKTATRASNILRGLRGFAREAAQDPMEPASIYEIVDQCVELQKPKLERHDVDFTVSMEAGIPSFLCREVQIGQILTNLVNNAFDAITQSDVPERWIDLTVKLALDCICIDVMDSGPGVEERFKEHLMEPFFTTKELGLGMGVGLSLSRAIAQDHNGTLTLLKDTRHTTFRLSLPISADPVAEVQREASFEGDPA